MAEQDQLAAFIASTHWDRFKGMRYAYVAFRRDGYSSNVACELVLDVDDPPGDWVHQGGVDDLAITRGWLSTADAKVAISELCGGRIKLGAEVLELRGLERGQQYGLSSHFWDRGAYGKYPWPATRLDGSGDTAIPSYRYSVLERHLVAAKPRRFPNFSSLAAFLGRSLAISSTHSAHVHCFAPVYARIEEVEYSFSDGTIVANVQCAETFLPHAVILISSRVGTLDPVVLGSTDWDRVSERLFRVTASFPTGTGPVRIQLVVDDALVDEKVGGVPAIATRAYCTFDPNASWIRKLIRDAEMKNDHAGFVHGIVSILNLGGIPTVDYSIRSPAHSADFVASFGAERLLVGECTTGPADEKIDQLAAAATAIEALVGPGTTPAVVKRVICIPRGRATVSMETRKRVDRLRIGIIAAEEAESALGAVTRGESAQALWSIFTAPDYGVFPE